VSRGASRTARPPIWHNDQPDGIVVHNPTNDIPLSWDEIAGFDAVTDASGMAITNPYAVGRVALHDGRSYNIEGTRLGGVLWRRARRLEEVQRSWKKYRGVCCNSTSCSRGDKARNRPQNDHF
jgi:hypothetical protein